MRSTIAFSLFAALLTSAAPAFAEPTPAERAMAETLFKEGKKLLGRGQTDAACEKLASSYQIDPAGGTLINLAMCHELQGKTATAWGEFNDALAMANKSRNGERQSAAKKHIAALERRLSRITLTLPPANAAPGLSIKLDGVAIAAGALGTGMPVDPGEHTASATAPGKVPWEQRITVKEKDAKTLELPALADVPAPPAPEPEPPEAPPWRKPVGAVGVGVGAAALVVGAVFGARAISLGGQVAKSCHAQACPPAGLDALSQGRTAATLANVMLPVGAVLAGGGVALLVLSAKPAAPPATGLQVFPVVGPRAAFFAVEGAF
jgi:hypothetical protein